MRANELSCKDLMIGDWVIPRVFDSKLEPSKIVGIHYNSYKGKDYVDWIDCEVWDELSIDDIEPIPLTPEILEKNGFVGELCSNGIDYVSEEYKLRIICKTNDVGWTIYANHFGLDKKDVFVHELQHALRLCGIKKEIKLED